MVLSLGTDRFPRWCGSWHATFDFRDGGKTVILGTCGFAGVVHVPQNLQEMAWLKWCRRVEPQSLGIHHSLPARGGGFVTNCVGAELATTATHSKSNMSLRLLFTTRCQWFCRSGGRWEAVRCASNCCKINGVKCGWPTGRSNLHSLWRLYLFSLCSVSTLNFQNSCLPTRMFPFVGVHRAVMSTVMSLCSQCCAFMFLACGLKTL